MHGREQSQGRILPTSFRIAAVTLAVTAIVLVLGVFSASGQNAVPRSAREAAALPQFAQRLAHPSTAPPQRPSPKAHPQACSPQPRGAYTSLPQDILYRNGPISGICDIQGCTVDAWTVNLGYTVTNSIGGSGGVSSATFAFWLFPGDTVTSVDWALGTTPFGSDIASGTASGSNVSQQLISSNQFGYSIYSVTINGLYGGVSSGNWLTLANAAVPTGDPVYWDENNGPSAAQESAIGTIPSESFNLSGGGPPACFSPQPQNGFTIIHDFTAKEDGGHPSGVAIDKSGNLYGPTQSGNGTIFKLSEVGSGWVLNSLYSFVGGANGSSPAGVIVGSNGILYGAASGGTQNCNGGDCGLIFGLRPTPTACRTSSCAWTENLLYGFTGLTDAWAGGGLVSDPAGNLYGVSDSGGAQQQGAVFELTPSMGGWMESILYSFSGGSDGGAPTGVIVGNDGNLYGTARLGGANGSGVVFQLTPSAQGWAEAVLYDVPTEPYWTKPHSLLQDSSGNLFGEYEDSPCCGNTYGVVFMLTPSNGKWVFTELRHGDEKYFGQDDFFNLAMDAAGNLYGAGGGYNGCIDPSYHAYIFKLTPGSDGWQYSTPVFFNGTPFNSDGALAIDTQGNVYGTTGDCGAYNKGTVWQLSP
jgi:uncharacterized repeat protein (TIGR03803 family)